ncbi:MAG: hypothetical protein GYA15_04525 [Leptolinea sp.]|jgi:hypothetical protein|nr:hypothetical protein [Leptolinea sp.]
MFTDSEKPDKTQSVLLIKLLGQNLFWIVVFLLVLLLLFEALITSGWIRPILPYPSPSANASFPELDVKFERLSRLDNVNCLFIGSSMADAGLSPEIFESELKATGKSKLTCLNMAISGSMVESSGMIVKSLIKWQSIKLVVIGLSPYDMDKTYTKTRPIASFPVFTYNDGQISMEGWLFNHFRLPWYFASLPRFNNASYQTGLTEWDKLINERGVRVTYDIGKIEKSSQDVILPDFTINPVDLQMLESVLNNLADKNIEAVVIEMPVHPDVFPYLIEGGEPEYEKVFVQPIQTLLGKTPAKFLRTQPFVTDIVNDEDWFNKNHLNYLGAKKLTIYLARKIAVEGILQ